MKILIVDDEEAIRRLLVMMLKSAGYSDLLEASSARHAFDLLGLGTGRPSEVDLVLTDLTMIGVDGLQITRQLRAVEELQDIPIIVVTARTSSDDLKAAFDAGATDYLAKPLQRVELVARVQAALKLKQEMDRRKAREQELMEATRQLREANEELQRISAQDGLTGLANRRHFDRTLEQEWRRACRTSGPLSLLMVDVDFFKAYNDSYGHLPGDDVLKQVAHLLGSMARRPADLAARFGGEEFALLLPATDDAGAAALAEELRRGVERLALPHKGSPISDHLTVSVGVATLVPSPDYDPAYLISAADGALYRAKQGGRNQVCLEREMAEK